MSSTLFSRSFSCLLFIFPCVCLFSAEENFLLINGETNEIVCEKGPNINRQITPCSTFKIALSLMGYDDNILIDENTPTWAFQDGYEDYFESWKDPQTPQSWMKNSCIWYSKVLANQLGLEKIQNYLVSFAYGNQDMSGELTIAWVNSTLKISPQEQVAFIQKMIGGKLLVSSQSIQMTKSILFKEELDEGWKLFGKTGWSGDTPDDQDDNNLAVGWFVGWLENDHIFFPFAYNIRDRKIDLSQRIPRVKQLLSEHILSEENID